MRLFAALLVLVGISAVPERARAIEPAAVEGATFNDISPDEPNPALAKAQILLDRTRFSPGAIDGRPGDNTGLAVKAFQQARDLDPTGDIDQRTWEDLTRADAEWVLQEYEIIAEDVDGPFAKIPDRMEEEAKLKKLSYSSPRELLAERFHVDEDFLTALNVGKDLAHAGTKIMVPKVRSGEIGKVARMIVEKDRNSLTAYDQDGRLLARYPATVGSASRPAPTGLFKVTKVVRNPVYTYNPKDKFEGVDADEPFDIAPGPNNPVGTVWIEIDKDGYGIHGTPDPEDIGKTASHGCVRLTNWDVEDLAAGVGKGTPVEFR
jgi:lipoprotein-anchoring transpeptidase ErfK/SrfK